ncbi:hypothetical protein Tco_0347867 [Tanacetum coccineum]
MSDFKDCVAEIEVEDISMSGLNFTWNKKHGKVGELLKKLDRVMGNVAFMTSFPTSYAHFLPFMTYDHTPDVFAIPEVSKAKLRPFKFYNYLTSKYGFIPVVKKVWNTDVEGYSMFSLVSMLKMLKKPVRKLNFDQGNLFANVEMLRLKLSLIQASMVANPHSIELREAEFVCLKAYKEALKDDELEELIEGEFLSWKTCVVFLTLVYLLISDGDAKFMIREVSDVEASWDVIGKDLCKAVRDFFVLGKLLKEVNSTVISLVPKLPTPRKVSDYRSIACCNVVYKCISKIIVNRIMGCLNSLVDHNQSAFIPSRNITDNVLLSQELLRGYHRNRGHTRLKTQDLMGVWEKNENMRCERNLRMFQDKARLVDVLINLIKDTVRLRVMSLSLNYSVQVYDATTLWKFHVERGAELSVLTLVLHFGLQIWIMAGGAGFLVHGEI